MPLLTNRFGLPQSIFDAISQDTYDGRLDLPTISVTTLIAPPKIRMLKIRHAEEISEDVSDNIWKLLGSSVHSMIERAETKDSLVEQRLEMRVGTKTVSGKTDIYTSDHCIQDYKVTSAWSVVYSPEGKTEWTNQLNVLALLYREAGFQVDRLQIIAILRDWSSTNAKRDSNYPQIPIVVIEITLWTKEEQIKYVTERVQIHSMVENIPDDNIPECSPEDRWQTETKFAVYKNANKRADKVCDSSIEAQSYIDVQDKKHSWRFEVRPGEDKRCSQCCQVKQFCHYGRNLGKIEMEI